MKKPKRIAVPQPVRLRLNKKNLGVCCVCKERGLGINYHHIDGNPSNNDDENIAVLCVKEHDKTHRPKAYEINHVELGPTKIKRFKLDWEQTVKECKSENPSIIAVLNIYGNKTNIHSARLVIQNAKSKIIYDRIYHLLTGNIDSWTDSIIEEIRWLGENVKLTIINKPLNVEYCPCCKNSLSNILDRNVFLRFTAKDWSIHSYCSIYINPNRASLALVMSYKKELIYSASLHKCGQNFLHFQCENYSERVPIKKNTNIKKQVGNVIKKILLNWKPGKLFIGSGNYCHPKLIASLKLPEVWELE
jgi:hypothetical protein